MATISLSSAAMDKIKEIIESESKKMNIKGLRFGVTGGGCSGFQYALSLESKDPDPKQDEILDFIGFKIFIDKKSVLYLTGTQIDYVEKLEKSGFVFSNPNAQKSCGCGESFDV